LASSRRNSGRAAAFSSAFRKSYDARIGGGMKIKASFMNAKFRAILRRTLPGVVAGLSLLAVLSLEAAAQSDPVDAPGAVALLPKDLSPWGMFLSARIVVKAVMLGLVFSSLVTWTIALAKGLELRAAKQRLRDQLSLLAKSASLARAENGLSGQHELGAAIHAAVLEMDVSKGLAAKDGIKERIASRLERIEATANRRMLRGSSVLATIGAIAPFVGLFGTVWGIMNAFIGISREHTTNLAIVAPGIAEALLATALGLFAAIPAVVIYNMFSRAIAGYRALYADGTAEILRLASRDLDRVATRPTPRDEVLATSAAG
jgi:biopolymer transport protein ExbB